MSALSRTLRAAGVLAVVVATWRCAVAAESPLGAVSAYVDAQAFLIARLGVKQLPWNELKSRLPDLVTQVTGDAGALPHVQPVVDQATQIREAFLAAGGKDVFAIVSPADIPYRPPFLVVTAVSAQKLEAVETFVRELVKPDGNNVAVRRDGDRAVLVGAASTLERLASLKAEPRAEVTAAASAATDAPIQVLLVPNADQHRVLNETFPAFPSPWQHITGAALSDGVQWAVLTVSVAPTLQAQLMVHAKNAAAAEELKRITSQSLDAAVQLPIVQQLVADAAQIRKQITPVVKDDSMSVTLTEEAMVQAVSKPLMAALAAARESARRSMSVNNLKQLALAMHCYHDVNKRFPAAATYDAAGKPLLSWRVQLLPFLDQDALYKQFKLDEPWDSENNKKLISQMPPLFADPAANLKPGMTTYLAPIGEGTMWSGKEGCRLSDIRDGTSNTLMIVNALPEKAVVWTKPDDLPVTEAQPLSGLVNDTRKMFETAFCDGSVRMLSAAIDPKILWLLLNANDGQPIDYDQVR